MPELPEVETIKRDLARVLPGKTIKDVEVRFGKFFNCTAEHFCRQIKRKKVLRLWRRAKVLGVDLAGGLSLLFHFKMTGQLVFKPNHGKIIMGGHPIEGVGYDLPNKFTHVIFHFTDGAALFFNDVRKFGWIRLFRTSGVRSQMSELGPEPLDRSFTVEVFKKILTRRPKARIKQVIMDQTLLVGVGNIYADEALFMACIKPMRRVKTLKESEQKKLWQAIRQVLKLSIKHRGTSFNSYVDGHGRKGTYWDLRKVYGRAGESCKKCGEILKRTVVGGRGTTYCGRCQK